ncbi:MAG: rRNA maturation RNase YbeY [Firmicutes bacterium]|nr:rRNA maturation RNase YbeY [Bacillota bacterium]
MAVIMSHDSLLISESVLAAMELIAERALQDHNLPQEAEISLTICDDQSIQALNKEWRNIDSPTDVLSFPLLEEMDDQFTEILLGDIVISLERAKEQAKDYGHSLERELLYLFTHGLLHLLGYDHGNAQEQREMRLVEEGLLQLVGAKRDEF